MIFTKSVPVLRNARFAEFIAQTVPRLPPKFLKIGLLHWTRYDNSLSLFIIISDSSVPPKQQQSVELLQLMVYTAAQTDAQEFIEMVFSTSAGQVVFNSYKDRIPLPEDVARTNGHEELAQFLQDEHARYCV